MKKLFFGLTFIVLSLCPAAAFSATVVAGSGGSWFGDGSDGDVLYTANTQITADTCDYVEINAKDFTIEAGVTLSVSNRIKGLYIFATDTVTINGTIDMAGMSCREDTDGGMYLRVTGTDTGPFAQLLDAVNLQGGRGGPSGLAAVYFPDTASTSVARVGDGGEVSGIQGGSHAGSGGVVRGDAINPTGPPPLGNSATGSAPGVPGDIFYGKDYYGGQGGAGGGAVIICAPNIVLGAASDIDCSGEDGANGTTPPSGSDNRIAVGGGGGGGGGVIALFSLSSPTVAGTQNVSGGDGSDYSAFYYKTRSSQGWAGTDGMKKKINIITGLVEDL